MLEKFLLRPKTFKPVEIYMYQRSVLGAETSSACANYPLKQAGVDNEKEFLNAAKEAYKHFHLNIVTKSIETTQKN